MSGSTKMANNKINVYNKNNLSENRRKESCNRNEAKQLFQNVSKVPFADICHRKVNGSNNWAKFKEKETANNLKSTSLESLSKKSRITGNNNYNYVKEFDIKIKDTNDKELILVEQKSGPSIGNRRYNKPPLLRQKYQNLNPKITKCIAIDCEMVGVDEDAKTNMLARVSLVNSYGDCIYDTFVKPLEPVVDYRTFVSGIRPTDLEKGEDFSKVQKDVSDLLKGRTLVGHALKNDLSVLFLSHPKGAIRDTSRYKKFYEGFKSTPSLKKLTTKYLGVNIQEGEHNSVEDAKAAMMLYMMVRKDWEAEIRRKRGRKMQTSQPSKTYRITCDDV